MEGEEPSIFTMQVSWEEGEGEGHNEANRFSNDGKVVV